MTIDEYLNKYDISVSKLAVKIGMYPPTLRNIRSGKGKMLQKHLDKLKELGITEFGVIDYED